MRPSLRERNLRALERQCEAFNLLHLVGDTIHVWSGPREGKSVAVRIKYPAQVLSGHTPVVYVTGARTGSIALSHVREA
ncbi:hypothetical protein [Methylobacterium sp. SyP6R]|uniref:hypothetical protein n=1 Tax=Methylobacterium sp. SyP6R TaxID=2718876 RepID=UPI001F2BBB6F|nr:hypothetical protein [Methylobacterium sp. SyP6R]MCF4125006.1 hypothetical protein [Methylobacterium sp. SyP6R]